MPESRAYTLQSRERTQKKKAGGVATAADDSPPRDQFRTMADSKMKHSYSLTSLSSRFLHGAGSSGNNNSSGTSGAGIGQQANGHHAHNSFTNGHHGTTISNGNSLLLNGKDCTELDGSDDYGFLSYNTTRGERDAVSTKISGPTSSKSLTTSLHSNFTSSNNNNNHNSNSNNNNNNGSNSGSFYSTATYGRMKQQQQQQQQLHHPQCQHHSSNVVGAGRQSKLKNGSVAPICACDCHLTMGTGATGNNNNNVGISSSTAPTGNGISSSSNNNNSTNHNGTNTLGSRTSSNSSSSSSGGSGGGGGGGGGSASTTTSSSSSASSGSNKINGFAGSLLNGATKKDTILKSFGSSALTTKQGGGTASVASGGGGVVSSATKYEMLRNNFFGSGITRERDPKLNSSCQALNLCPPSNGNVNGAGNVSGNNASSIYGASSMTTSLTHGNNNNNDSLINGLSNNNGGVSSSKLGSRGTGTRVRRTISCYAKNPSKLDSLENNLSQQAAGFGVVEKDLYLGSSMMNMSSAGNNSHLHHHHHLSNGHHHHSVNGFMGTAPTGINGGLGASTASIVHYQQQQHAGGGGAINGHHHHHLSNAAAPGVGGASFPNPICEFSPFSSMSSTDLIGLRMTNGFGAGGIDRRYLGSNGSANFTVYYHDNPIDCGCSSCFQKKLEIFQVSIKITFLV